MFLRLSPSERCLPSWSTRNRGVPPSQLHIRPSASILAFHLFKKLLFISAKYPGLLQPHHTFHMPRPLDTRLAYTSLGVEPQTISSEALPLRRRIGLSFWLFARILAPLRILRKRIRLAIILHDRFSWLLSGFIFCSSRHHALDTGLFMFPPRHVKRIGVPAFLSLGPNCYKGMSSGLHATLALRALSFPWPSTLRLFFYCAHTSRMVLKVPIVPVNVLPWSQPSTH